MPKVLNATCVAGVVTADSLPVPSAAVLSEGVKSSEGILVLDHEDATYLTSNASDIKDLITAIGNVCDKIITTLTAIDAVTLAPGSNAANIALITVAKTQLMLQKDMLK